jgi:hypothetical protein
MNGETVQPGWWSTASNSGVQCGICCAMLSRRWTIVGNPAAVAVPALEPCGAALPRTAGLISSCTPETVSGAHSSRANEHERGWGC